MARGKSKPAGKAGGFGFGGRGMKKNLTKVMFSMDPQHLQDLRREAARRMVERGAGRADTSELVREAVESWLKKRGR
jgi:hypothetical protein